MSQLVLMLSTGFEPLFQTTWKRALSAVFGGRAEIIETHETLTIGTASGDFPYPVKVRFTSGVMIGKLKGINRHAPLSKKNIFLRDEGKCQYCHKNLALSTCTIDHIVPKSKGGMNRWENVVLSCSKCNQKKGARLLSEINMALTKKPVQPPLNDLLFVRLT